MRIVADDIGAGGVSSAAESGSSRKEVQQFIPTMEAAIRALRPIARRAGRFPYGCQLFGIVEKDTGGVCMDLGQLTGVLSTFSVLHSWLPHFA